MSISDSSSGSDGLSKGQCQNFAINREWDILLKFYITVFGIEHSVLKPNSWTDNFVEVSRHKIWECSDLRFKGVHGGGVKSVVAVTVNSKEENS